MPEYNKKAGEGQLCFFCLKGDIHLLLHLDIGASGSQTLPTQTKVYTFGSSGPDPFDLD
jgi:hypothetical protein